MLVERGGTRKGDIDGGEESNNAEGGMEIDY
jgi:hypothetical protein